MLHCEKKYEKTTNITRCGCEKLIIVMRSKKGKFSAQFSYSDNHTWQQKPFFYDSYIYTDTTEYAAMLFITNAARTYLRIYKRAYCLAEHIWKEYMDSRQNLLSF